MPPQVVFHVVPRGETPLAPDTLETVRQLVEEKETEIGHADLIDVRVAEGESHVALAYVLHYPVRLDTQVAGRARDVLREQKHTGLR